MQQPLPLSGAVLPAGGTGTRFGADRPKQFLDLAGVPLLIRTCRALIGVHELSRLALAAPAAHLQETADLIRTHLTPEQASRIMIVTGGAERQDSVLAGLRALPPEIELVLIHDAARPLVDRETILACLHEAARHGAAIAAMPAADTLKEVGADNTILRTVDRKQLWRAQTPQAAQRALLERAFARAHETGFTGTDEASILEAAGIPVRVVPGSGRNLKITRPEDLAIAAALLAEESVMKIGHGFDVHRLVSGRPLILGGVHIDYPLGLDGHSDADVVAHALTDALLGSLGAGDLGRHFPDSDPRYKGIDSLLLLQQVAAMAADRGYVLANADITIVCQQPRLAAHLNAMQSNLARSCRVAAEAVNLKATTTEKMGYTGRGEGIAAHAVVLLRSVHGY
ncbi:MAG: 2-C-methyl-D-erythritol 4-phosphate cytidylyltransferase [Desulfobulbus sp.]